MAAAIKKYLDNGVLNYVDHENPKHYFLWDGELPPDDVVHRLVEDLCDEIVDLTRQLSDIEWKARRQAGRPRPLE